MDTTILSTNLTEDQINYRIQQSHEARTEILESSDFPGIETKYEEEGGYPGMPAWVAPEEGDWRIVGTCMYEGYVVVTEECIGYTEIGHYEIEDMDGTTHERVLSYYVSVVPGYRATRLRKVWSDDIHMAGLEEDGSLSEKRR